MPSTNYLFLGNQDLENFSTGAGGAQGFVPVRMVAEGEFVPLLAGAVVAKGAILIEDVPPRLKRLRRGKADVPPRLKRLRRGKAVKVKRLYRQERQLLGAAREEKQKQGSLSGAKDEMITTTDPASDDGDPADTHGDAPAADENCGHGPYKSGTGYMKHWGLNHQGLPLPYPRVKEEMMDESGSSFDSRDERELAEFVGIRIWKTILPNSTSKTLHKN